MLFLFDVFNKLIIQKKALLLLNNSNTRNQKQHSELEVRTV